MLMKPILDVADFDGLVQRGYRIVTVCGRGFVSEVAGEVEIGDGLGDEAIVQLLRFVDVVTSGIAARMKVAALLEMVANVAHDVAVHDLRVVDVEEDLHSWRIDA